MPTVEDFVEFSWWGVFDEVRSYPHLIGGTASIRQLRYFNDE